MTEKPLVAHIEKYLGRIKEAWTHSLDNEIMPFAVAECQSDSQIADRSFITLGLSNFALKSIVSPKTIRQELLMLTDESSAIAPPSILQQVGLEAIERGYAYLRGDVIGPRGLFASDSNMAALYVAAPVYLPDAFAGCDSDKLGRIVIAWLVPITMSEARLIHEEGWQVFEDLLMEQQPDMTNTHRQEIVRGR